MKKTGYENVLLFPQKDGMPKVTLPEVIDNTVTQTRREYVEGCMHALLPHIMMMLAASGFDPTDQDCMKDGFLFVETLKSMMLKTSGISHPMQAVAERAFATRNETEFGVEYDYEIIDSLFKDAPTEPATE